MSAEPKRTRSRKRRRAGPRAIVRPDPDDPSCLLVEVLGGPVFHVEADACGEALARLGWSLQTPLRIAAEAREVGTRWGHLVQHYEIDYRGIRAWVERRRTGLCRASCNALNLDVEADDMEALVVSLFARIDRAMGPP